MHDAHDRRLQFLLRDMLELALETHVPHREVVGAQQPVGAEGEREQYGQQCEQQQRGLEQAYALVRISPCRISA